jgi:hypothetical protein
VRGPEAECRTTGAANGTAAQGNLLKWLDVRAEPGSCLAIHYFHIGFARLRPYAHHEPLDKNSCRILPNP